MHAEEDKKKRELVETKNHADALIYSTERTLRDMGDKVDAKTRQDIEAQVQNLKQAMEGSDRDAIQREMDQLTTVSHKLAEEAYKKAAEQQAAGAGAGAGQQEAGGAGKKPDDDVVDADFQEVKDK